MTKDMTNDIQTAQHDGPQQGEIILYQPDETVRLEVRLEDDTVWLTQQQMAELFGRERSVIAKHISLPSMGGVKPLMMMLLMPMAAGVEEVWGQISV